MAIINTMGTGVGGTASASIVIKRPPIKRRYYEGERLTLQGMEVWLYQPNKEPLQVQGYISIPEANTELTRSDTSVLIQYQTQDKEYVYASVDINVLYPVALREVISPSVDRGQDKYKLNASEMKYNLEYNDGSLIEVSNDSLTTDPSSVTETNGTIAVDSLVKYSVTHNDTLLKFVGRMYTAPQNVINNINICTFASGTWEEIGKLMKQNDAGELTLTNYWKVGDERKERINDKVYTMVILDLNKTTSGGTKYNAAIGFKDLIDTSAKIAKYVNTYPDIYGTSMSFRDFYEIRNFPADGGNANIFKPCIGVYKEYGSKFSGYVPQPNITEIADQEGILPVHTDDYTNSLIPKNIKDMIIKTKIITKTTKISSKTKVPPLEDLNINLTGYSRSHTELVENTDYNNTYAELYYYSKLVTNEIITIDNTNYFHLYSIENIIGDSAFEYYKTSSNRIKKLNGTPQVWYLSNPVYVKQETDVAYEPFVSYSYSEYGETWRNSDSPNSNHTRVASRGKRAKVYQSSLINRPYEYAHITESGDIIYEFNNGMKLLPERSESERSESGYTSSFFCI